MNFFGFTEQAAGGNRGSILAGRQAVDGESSATVGVGGVCFVGGKIGERDAGTGQRAAVGVFDRTENGAYARARFDGGHVALREGRGRESRAAGEEDRCG